MLGTGTGYLIFLRPLLLIFSVTGIRILLTIILGVLLIIVFNLIYKKINLGVALSILIGFLSVDYFIIGVSLQYSPIFIVTGIAIVVILLLHDKIKDIGYIFFLIGIFTTVFDLLTVPLLSLIIPLMVYLLIIMKNNNMTHKEVCTTILKLTVNWCIGYVLFWALKWIVADLVCNTNILKVALEKISQRTSQGNYDFIWTLQDNIQYVKFAIAITEIMACVGVELAAFKKPKELMNILPFVVIGMSPFVWMFFIRNHSYIHSFFVYRILAIKIIANLIIFYQLISKMSNAQKTKNNIKNHLLNHERKQI